MSNGTTTAKESLHKGSRTASCQKPLFSAMSEHSSVRGTPKHIREWLMLSRRGSHAHPSQPHLEGGEQPRTSGPIRARLLKGCDLHSYLQKMSPKERLETLRWICGPMVTLPESQRCQRQTWVLTTYGQGTGYLHTPTCNANYQAKSMQKWPGCREFVRVFGKATPKNQEWMMGWPIGWTDLKPLEMDKFQSAWLRHFNYFQKE